MQFSDAKELRDYKKALCVVSFYREKWSYFT